MIQLLHGDCLELMPTLPDASIDAIIADLPYGTTACSWDAVIPFEPLWAQYKRVIKPAGVVYEDKTPRFLQAGASLAVTFEMQQPVRTYSLDGGDLPDAALTVSTLQGVPITITNSVDEEAVGRLVVTFTNGNAVPVILSAVKITGRPIGPAEEGIAEVGSGTPERELSDDVGIYVQSREHALRLGRLYLDFYGTVRERRTLSGCGYDPDRTVAELVGLTFAAWSLSASAHRINSIRHYETGGKMDVTLSPVAGLPTTATVFMVGTTYSSGDTRELSY